MQCPITSESGMQVSQGPDSNKDPNASKQKRAKAEKRRIEKRSRKTSAKQVLKREFVETLLSASVRVLGASLCAPNH